VSRSIGISSLSAARREFIAGYLFISPWLIGFLAFLLVPIVTSFGLSFTKADFLSPTVFVGLRNFRTILLEDELFRKSLVNTTYYSLVRVPSGILLALVMALFLNRNMAGVSVFRTIYYLPSVVSGVAVSLLWVWIFQPDWGLANTLLAALGLPRLRWLQSETWAMPVIIITSLWGVGGSMIIYLAGLRSIPAELYEAASLDGAAVWRQFIHVTLPLLTPTLFYGLITGIIGSFQVFTASYIMTGGGPANATLTYVLYLYRKAFEQFHMGYGCALAWILLIMILSLTLVVFRTSSAWVFYEAELKGRG